MVFHTELALAAQVRQQLGLAPTLSIRNLFELLRAQGIPVIRYPFGFDGSTAALLCQMEESRYIVVDSKQTLGRQIFSVAHELGHLFAHGDRLFFTCAPDETPPWDPNPSIERFADRFAAAFLVPQPAVETWAAQHQIDLTNLSLHQFMRLHQAFQVSYAMALNRLQEFGWITSETRTEWGAQSPVGLARRWGLPLDLYQADGKTEVPEAYLALWVDAYEAGNVSYARIRAALDLIGVRVDELELRHPMEVDDVI